MITPTVSATFDRVTARFGDTLHFTFRRSRWVGLQSWRDGDTYFAIEIVMNGGANLTLEYDRVEKWTAVLGQLDALLS